MLMWDYQSHNFSGALSKQGKRHDSAGGTGSSYFDRLTINASKSCSIYNGTTFQPKAGLTLLCIKA